MNHLSILSRSPTAFGDPRDAVDPILAAIALEIPVRLLLVDGGVQWLGTVEAARPLRQIEFFDGWEILVEAEAPAAEAPERPLPFTRIERCQLPSVVNASDGSDALHLSVGQPDDGWFARLRSRVGGAPILAAGGGVWRKVDGSGELGSALDDYVVAALVRDHSCIRHWYV